MEPDYPIPSPCVGVCQIDARTKFCLGCFRTLKEVARWSRFAEEEKRAVVAELRKRQAAAGKGRRRVTRREARRRAGRAAGA